MIMNFGKSRSLAALSVLGLAATACGSTASVASDAGDAGAVDAEVAGAETSSDLPTIAVTTNILGDVVENLVGDTANVITVMPVGADPHDFQASAQQVNDMGTADAVVINGAFFEEGIWDIIETVEADGVPLFASIDAVSTIEFGEDVHGHEGEEEGEESHDDEEEGEESHDDEEGEESHDDEEGDEHGHEEGGADPHFFTDPARMATAAAAISEFLTDTVEGIDTEALAANTEAYVGELEALDGEVTEILSTLSDEQRVLITNHEVFGYFADNYGFEVVGAVIPSGSTADGADAGALAELAEEIEHEGVSAIFADFSASDELIETLAAEVGDVDVVELFSESLGDADSEGATYTDMVRTNADRIAAALGS